MNGDCPPSEIYLKVLFEYFKQAQNWSEEEKEEHVEFHRRCIPEEVSWEESEVKLLNSLEISLDGKIGDTFLDALEVDFANKEISFGRGMTCPDRH